MNGDWEMWSVCVKMSPKHSEHIWILNMIKYPKHVVYGMKIGESILRSTRIHSIISAMHLSIGWETCVMMF